MLLQLLHPLLSGDPSTQDGSAALDKEVETLLSVEDSKGYSSLQKAVFSNRNISPWSYHSLFNNDYCPFHQIMCFKCEQVGTGISMEKDFSCGGFREGGKLSNQYKSLKSERSGSFAMVGSPLKSPARWTEMCWYTNKFAPLWWLQELLFTVGREIWDGEMGKTCSSLIRKDWITFKEMNCRFLTTDPLFRWAVSWGWRTLQSFIWTSSSNIKKP